MNPHNLNEVEIHGETWQSVAFAFDRINTGGIYIDSKDFDGNLEKIGGYTCRVYRNPKRIVVSGKGCPSKYCAIDWSYAYWKCMVCKKLGKIGDKQCFCGSYSTCWTPIKPQIRSLVFSDTCDFRHHFAEDNLNLIYEPTYNEDTP